jgi:hypothetical protein
MLACVVGLVLDSGIEGTRSFDSLRTTDPETQRRINRCTVLQFLSDLGKWLCLWFVVVLTFIVRRVRTCFLRKVPAAQQSVSDFKKRTHRTHE